MSSSRIEQIIEEIEDYVEGCRFQPLSSTKIVVNKEELQELLRELRLKTPDDSLRARCAPAGPSHRSHGSRTS